MAKRIVTRGGRKYARDVKQQNSFNETLTDKANITKGLKAPRVRKTQKVDNTKSEQKIQRLGSMMQKQGFSEGRINKVISKRREDQQGMAGIKQQATDIAKGTLTGQPQMQQTPTGRPILKAREGQAAQQAPQPTAQQPQAGQQPQAPQPTAGEQFAAQIGQQAAAAPPEDEELATARAQFQESVTAARDAAKSRQQAEFDRVRKQQMTEEELRREQISEQQAAIEQAARSATSRGKSAAWVEGIRERGKLDVQRMTKNLDKMINTNQLNLQDMRDQARAIELSGDVEVAQAQMQFVQQKVNEKRQANKEALERQYKQQKTKEDRLFKIASQTEGFEIDPEQLQNDVVALREVEKPSMAAEMARFGENMGEFQQMAEQMGMELDPNAISKSMATKFFSEQGLDVPEGLFKGNEDMTTATLDYIKTLDEFKSPEMVRQLSALEQTKKIEDRQYNTALLDSYAKTLERDIEPGFFEKEKFKADLNSMKNQRDFNQDLYKEKYKHELGKQDSIFGGTNVYSIGGADVEKTTKTGAKYNPQTESWEFGQSLNRVNGKQCGGSTNDWLGLEGGEAMGDSYSTKVDQIPIDHQSKNGLNQIPIEGGYWVMKNIGGRYGHVGVTNKAGKNPQAGNNKWGSWEAGQEGVWVTDRNRDGREGLRENVFIPKGTREYNLIEGFGAKGLGRKSMAQVRQGYKVPTVVPPEQERDQTQIAQSIIGDPVIDGYIERYAKGAIDADDLKKFGYSQKEIGEIDAMAQQIDIQEEILPAQDNLKISEIAERMGGTARMKESNVKEIEKLRKDGKDFSVIQNELLFSDVSPNFTPEYQEAYLGLTMDDTPKKAESKKRSIDTFLAKGDTEGARRYVESIAKNNLTATQKDSYNMYDTVTNEGQKALNFIDNHPEVDAGKWDTMWEQAKKWGDVSKDQDLLRLKSSIEQMQAQYKRSLFGAAMTETELGQAGNFIIGNDDTIKDIQTKIKTQQDFVSGVKERMIWDQIGGNPFQRAGEQQAQQRGQQFQSNIETLISGQAETGSFDQDDQNLFDSF